MPASFIGEIVWTVASSPPEGSLPCDGSLVSIEDHTALFAIIGIHFGGDGITTFGLPDLRDTLPLSLDFSNPQTKMGRRTPAAGIAVESDSPSPSMPGTLAVQACIVTTGLFPSRS